jgi:NAD(P)-dependent dehydrogenase (short-subunit alcohol dehydrogenase family)
MSNITKSILMLIVAVPLAGQAQTPEITASKAVLVTGASTGIGRKVTEQLAADGYFVYAGARKDADLKALGALKNVQAVRLDVTDQKDIDAAVETVKKGGRGLYGLVNNAGVLAYGSVADTKWDEVELVTAVNVYGPWRVTKAFEPLIVAQQGRITNIGSIAGILASADVTAYSMSKHAMKRSPIRLQNRCLRLACRSMLSNPVTTNPRSEGMPPRALALRRALRIGPNTRNPTKSPTPWSRRFSSPIQNAGI